MLGRATVRRAGRPCVISDAGKLDDAGCRGAPDWIVEVLSPTTAGHDQIIKRRHAANGSDSPDTSHRDVDLPITGLPLSVGGFREHPANR